MIPTKREPFKPDAAPFQEWVLGVIAAASERGLLVYALEGGAVTLVPADQQSTEIRLSGVLVSGSLIRDLFRPVGGTDDEPKATPA